MVVWIEITAGPDAGRGVELSSGRHLVGRAGHCALVIADPAVEANHVVLAIGHDDRFEVVQLAGRVPVVVGPDHLELGDTRIDLRPPPPVAGLVLGMTVETLGSTGGQPVVLSTDPLLIVDDHPDLARGHAVVRSLTSQAAAQELTAPECVVTTPDDPALDDCDSILELGARWRARYGSIRLHAAGQTVPRQGDLPSPPTYVNSDACRSAIFQPSPVRSNRSANSPTRYVTS